MSDEYERLFLEAPFGYLATDADGVIVRVNDTLLGWLGRDRPAVVGSPFVSLLDAGSRIFWETRHQPVLLLSGEVREVALTLAGVHEPLSVLVNTSVIPGDGGERIGTRIALLDIRERFAYERSLLSDTRAAESAGTRLRALQSLSVQLVTSVSEQQIVDALVASAQDAFTATTVTVFLADDDGELLRGRRCGARPRIRRRGDASVRGGPSRHRRRARPGARRFRSSSR